MNDASVREFANRLAGSSDKEAAELLAGMAEKMRLGQSRC
jgi:hypothetical protein